MVTVYEDRAKISIETTLVDQYDPYTFTIIAVIDRVRVVLFDQE
jgi:hypothetical protein